MAQNVQVQLIDDLDGTSPADETVAFSLEGREYEIDLNSEHADALRVTLEPFVNAARRTGGRLRRSRGAARTETAVAPVAATPTADSPLFSEAESAPPQSRMASLPAPRTAALRSTPALPATVDREQIAAIRAWGRDNGWEVKDRGRVPMDVIAAYTQAHSRRNRR